MKVEATIQDFVNWIAELLHANIEETGEVYVLRLRDAEKLLRICTGDMGAILERLLARDELEDTAIFDGHYYEILVRVESPRPVYNRRIGDEVLRDDENDITYTLSRPSDEFTLFLLYKLSTVAPIGYVLGPSFHAPRALSTGENAEYTLSDIPDLIGRRFRTLRIESGPSRKASEFMDFANAFFLQLSYNLDLAIVPQRYLDEIIRIGRMARIRRASAEELEPPKRFYEPDLVYHYQMATATDSPLLEYLSYYHIAEYFFGTVSQNELIERVKSRLTRPDFSYKRKKDIRALIDEISKAIRYRGDSIAFSEQEALRLTLQQYVDTTELLQEVREYDSSLVEYYRTHKVSFSDGDQVDLGSDDKERVLQALARRIYKTRNAVVHSKGDEKSRYIPFRHDRELIKEAPLLRFVAEAIIVGSSRLIP